jgi:hypothetical protein
VPLAELVADALAALSADATTGLTVALDVAGAWDVPRREAALVLRGVLRRLLGSTTGGRLVVGADATTLTFALYPHGGATGPDASRGDTGAASTLVARLADALGWRIEFGGEADGPRTVRIVRTRAVS